MRHKIKDLFKILFLSLLILQGVSGVVYAVTVTPNTWNIIGLDSNSPASGPYQFTVGAKVSGGTPSGSGTATFSWEAGGTENNDAYIKLSSGSLSMFTCT